MAKIKINANDVDGATAVQVRYRLAGSSGTYTVVDVAPISLPYLSEDTLPAGLYEIGVRKQCGDIWSNWVSGQTNTCPAPLSFSANKSGNFFNVIYGLSPGQTHFEVEVTDPNNGKSVFPFTGPAEGLKSIAINPVIQGQYSLRLRGICSIGSTPNWKSDWSSPVYVDVVSACNAPLVAAVNIQSQNDTTVTNRLSLSGYTTNIRVRVFDNNAGIDVINEVRVGSATTDIMTFKGGNFTAYISNICFGGEEQTTLATLKPGSVSLMVRVGNNSGTICAGSFTNVYISAGSSVSYGVTLYTDVAMTIPLTTYIYVVNTETGEIFNLDPAAGVVGVSTGVSC